MPASLSSTIRKANRVLLAETKHERVGNFFAADYVAHVTGQDLKGGHSIVRGFLDLYQWAFPKLSVDVEILIEGDNRVAWQRTLSAIHRGPFKGFPASGRKVIWRDVVTSRFRGGMIIEDWVISDLAEQLLLSRKKC